MEVNFYANDKGDWIFMDRKRSEEELMHYYEKKPKSILVLDCVYLASERQKEREENRRLTMELHESKRRADRSGMTAAILKDTVTKLFQQV